MTGLSPAMQFTPEVPKGKSMAFSGSDAFSPAEIVEQICDIVAAKALLLLLKMAMLGGSVTSAYSVIYRSRAGVWRQAIYTESDLEKVIASLTSNYREFSESCRKRV